MQAETASNGIQETVIEVAVVCYDIEEDRLKSNLRLTLTYFWRGRGRVLHLESIRDQQEGR
jgi:hypothetical protein